MAQGKVRVSCTLVILVPTNEGIVAAADGINVDRLHIRSPSKFAVVKPARVVFAITGASRLLPRLIDSSGFKGWISKIVPPFDGDRVVVRHLRRHRPRAMDQEYVALLSAHFVQALAGRLSRDTSVTETYGAKETCCVILAQYQRATRLATIASFVTGVTGHGTAEVDESLFETFRPQDEFALLKFGDTDYLDTHVLREAGRRHLGEGFFRRIEAVNRISDLNSSDAAYIAHALIAAASKTAEETPGPAGGGEGIQILLIDGSDSVARELRRGIDYE